MAIVRDPDEPATVVSLWLVALLMVVLAVVLLAIFYGFAVRHWFDFDKPAVAAPASSSAASASPSAPASESASPSASSSP